MNRVIQQIFVIFILVAFLPLSNVFSEEDADWIQQPAEHFLGLRNLMITSDPDALSIDIEDNGVVAWGVLMEFITSGTVVSLVGLLDGNASLYFSNGGGIIGGVGHENVRKAAQKFVELSNEFIPNMEKVAECQLPKKGRVRFHILTTKGIYSIEKRELLLRNKIGKFSQLYNAGHELIYEVSVVSENEY